jgi:hypothetical protein
MDDYKQGVVRRWGGRYQDYFKILSLGSLGKIAINLIEVSWSEYRVGLPLGEHSV